MTEQKRVLSEEEICELETWIRHDGVITQQTGLNLIATIRDRDKTIAEWQKMCDKQTKHWLVEQAENQKLQRQNVLMLEALELAETAILNGDDPELVLSHIQEALSQVKGASE